MDLHRNNSHSHTLHFFTTWALTLAPFTFLVLHDLNNARANTFAFGENENYVLLNLSATKVVT
jgi:hypothetical protein